MEQTKEYIARTSGLKTKELKLRESYAKKEIDI